MDPAALLVGPRGQRVCLEYALSLSAGPESDLLRTAVSSAAHELDPDRGTARVFLGSGSASTPRHTPQDVARLLADLPTPQPDQRALLLLLAATVDSARYWQPPEGEDFLAAAPELQAPIARFALSLAQAPHAAWWDSPLDTTAQWDVEFIETPPGQANTGRSNETLDDWSAAQLGEEARAARDRPADPEANWSGTWWSTPPPFLTRTTRALDGLGPVGLWLVEDSLGWDEAQARRMEFPTGARVYEIESPQALADLCGRYPLEVTASRRHDWYRTTGRTGNWVIPDWSRVAADYDAVHLCVSGYLMTAGRAIPVGNDQATVLAGWAPDQTYWLSPVEKRDSSDQSWTRDETENWMVG